MSAEPLSSLDAAFVAAETPTMPLHVLAVAVLDPGSGGLGVASLRRLVTERLGGQRRLWQRVVRVPFGLDHPVWVDDPGVDLEHHVRRAGLPTPGGDRELAAFVAETAARPLDADRPLWELHLVEGLEHGHVALVAKVHHALFDGVSGIAAFAGLFDASPSTSSSAASGAPSSRPVGPPPGSLDLLAGAVRRWVSRPLTVADTVAGTYLALRSWSGWPGVARPGSGGADPGRGDLSGGAHGDPADGDPADGDPADGDPADGDPADGDPADGDPADGDPAGGDPAGGDPAGDPADRDPAGAGTMRPGPGTPGQPLPFRVPKAPWNGTISLRRASAVVQLPLDDLRAVTRAWGGTLNDVILAAVSGALRRRAAAHPGRPGLERGAPLVAGVPVSVRRPEQPVVDGNRVSAMLVPLATDVDGPRERYQQVTTATTAAKQREAIVPEHVVLGWAELAVPALATRLTRLAANLRAFDRVAPMVNVVVSNVVGPSEPLWCRGARLVDLYPFGPVADGVGLNISAVSYRSTMYVGLLACRDHVPDLDGLAADVADAAAELAKLARGRGGHGEG